MKTVVRQIFRRKGTIREALCTCLPIALVLFASACQPSLNPPPTTSRQDEDFISAVDISSYPEVSAAGGVFYNSRGEADDLLRILKRHGVNTIRLRLWVAPENAHASFAAVQSFSAEIKRQGFKLWLSLHYSDTWADPGQQIPPDRWRGLAFSALRDSVRSYTQRIAENLQPDYVQIGNEINSGFLHPTGNLAQNPVQFQELLKTAILALRERSPRAKIILHHAGIANAVGFFERVAPLDYDMIGLSYYPVWHGKNLDELATTIAALSRNFGKEIVIAETAYPFTLDWNDWTNNIVGLPEQLILPDYPASPEGQADFVRRVKSIVRDDALGKGICYWGAELIAWRGAQATDASPWENQALFDFSGKALPAVRALGGE